MSRQSRHSKKESARITAKIDALQAVVKSQEEQLAQVHTLVKEMMKKFDNLIGVSGSKKPHFQKVSGVYEKGPNPWAIEASRSLVKAMAAMDDASMKRRVRTLFETYKPTLEALQSAPKGLTADQVGEKTGRSRNTESSYLVKLHLAGYLDRLRKGAKVLYKVKEGEELANVFGET